MRPASTTSLKGLDMTKDHLEVLARMWIDCDPNRPNNADVLMSEMEGDLKNQPRWRWFLPRAEAALKYLRDEGYSIERVPDTSLNRPYSNPDTTGIQADHLDALEAEALAGDAPSQFKK